MTADRSLGLVDSLLERVPNRHKFDTLYGLLALVVAAGLVAVGFAAAPVIRQTRTVHVEKSFGHVTQTIPASAVSVQGTPVTQAGMSVCDYYASKRTLVCH